MFCNLQVGLQEGGDLLQNLVLYWLIYIFSLPLYYKWDYDKQIIVSENRYFIVFIDFEWFH